jgi:hypothetical protein
MKVKQISALGVSVLSAGFISLGGVAAADSMSWSGGQSSYVNRYGGWQSGWNDWRFKHHKDFRNTTNIRNTNDVRITNTNNQTARTGDARVSGNLIGGDAISGDANNYNSSNFDVNIRN